MASDAPQPPEAENQFELLRTRRFLPFFLTQFFGAANDNVFKFAFTVLATYSAAPRPARRSRWQACPFTRSTSTWPSW